MFIILPVIVLAELTFLFYCFAPQRQRSLREAFLVAAVLICACATILAEGLGIFSAVNVWTIRGSWLVAAGLLMGVSFRKRTFLSWRIHMVRLTWSEGMIFCAVVFIALLSAMIAFQCPPNTADSMAYHLPRVMFWAQNGSLSYYPTPNLRQLNYPPGAEILLLHFYLLAGDDRWLNFFQWFAMIGSVVGVSVLAGRLGAGTRGQLFSALVAATVPMGVLQSNSTQTDYVLTFWVICTAVFVWRAVFAKDEASVVWTGLSVGLAVLTKGTAFITLPFLIYLFWLGRNKGFVRTMKMIGILLGLLILLNVSYWTRNILAQPGHGIFPENEKNLFVEHFWPQGIAANMIRHCALQFMTPFDAQVKALHDFVFMIEDRLGVAHDDGRIFSYEPAKAFSGHYVFNEDVAANMLHFLFGTAIIFIALFFWSGQKRVYAGCVLAACFLFVCVVKWQPWASRFHLPLFLLAAPLVGIGINRMRAWGWGVGVVLVIFVVSLLITHNLRPLIGNPNIFTFPDRRMWYFAHIQDLSGSYGQVAQLVSSSGCKNIGLITGEGAYEYPLWPLISPDRSVRFYYMDVNNFSRNFRKEPQEPCLVLTLDMKQPQMLILDGKNYLGVWQDDFFQLYSSVNVR